MTTSPQLKQLCVIGAIVNHRCGPFRLECDLTTHLDVLQQVVHVSDCEPVEEGIWFVHLHSKVVILCADVLGQKIDGLGTAVTNSDLGPKHRTHRNVQMMHVRIQERL